MATAVVQRVDSEYKLIAPWWHTAILVTFFVLLAAGGMAMQYGARTGAGLLGHRPSVALLYVSQIASEWGLVYYVWRGLRRTGTRLSEVVGGRWANPRSVIADLVLGMAVWSLWKGFIFCW